MAIKFSDTVNGIQGLYDRQDRIEGLVIPKKVGVFYSDSIATKELLLSLTMIGVEEIYLYGGYEYQSYSYELVTLRPYLKIFIEKNLNYEEFDHFFSVLPDNLLFPKGIIPKFKNKKNHYVLNNGRVYINPDLKNVNLTLLDNVKPIHIYDNINIYFAVHFMVFPNNFTEYLDTNNKVIESHLLFNKLLNIIVNKTKLYKRKPKAVKLRGGKLPKKIHIIGVGGIGYNLANILPYHNNYISYDPDTIELSNLSRLPIPPNMVGYFKANDYTKTILGRSSLSDRDNGLCNSYNTKKDIIIDCRDNLKPEFLHKDTAFKLSYDGGENIAIYLRPQDTAHMILSTDDGSSTYRVDPSYFIPPRLLANLGYYLSTFLFIKQIHTDKYLSKEMSIDINFNITSLIKEFTTEVNNDI